MLEDRTCVVTGANSGIGKHTALGLASLGAKVILVCRNEARGRRVLEEVKGKTGSGEVELLQCDLSSLVEVRRLAGVILARYQRLHVLVNNAGTVSFFGRSVDGFETTIVVNYLAPFLLTNLLLDRLRASAPSRIINVSSVAHFGGHIDFERISEGRWRRGMGAYSDSKLALVMFTYELARRLQVTGVTANCLHPGGVATPIWRIPVFMTRPFLIGAEEGARTSIHLASAPESEIPTGEYFDQMVRQRSSWESYDRKKQEELWNITEKLVGLS